MVLRAVHGVPHVVRLLAEGPLVTRIHDSSTYAMLLEPHGRALQVDDETGLIARAAVHVAQALSTCHSLGVAHRDVTPTNFIIHDGEGYLIDFSVGKVRTTVTAHVATARLCPLFGLHEVV